MSTRVFLLAFVVAVAVACDDEAPPETCASWLDCYERCDPLAFVDDDEPTFGPALVQSCSDECSTASWSSNAGPSWAIVTRDLSLANVQAGDDVRVQAAIGALRARAACLLAGE